MKASFHGSENAKSQGLTHPGFLIGGGKGIRTPGPVTRTTVFKTAAFDRSAIPPGAKVIFFLLLLNMEDDFKEKQDQNIARLPETLFICEFYRVL
jgi:hypothetical protein